jgi:hypothetical protein
MLLTLLSSKDGPGFTDAIKAVRQSYLTGKYAINGKELELPYAKSFITFFGKQTNKPDLSKCIENSDNYGHYNHFCNVVASMAHILHYAEHNMKAYLPDEAFTPQRKLDCLFTAYYHDIGKTIIPRRHAVEGKALLAERKASVIHLFEAIFAQHPDCNLSALTLSVYTERIGAHDLFGTLSTGENGLLSLCGVVNIFKDLFDGRKEEVQSAIIDLWLLNLADIITSVPEWGGKPQNKFVPQDWTSVKPGGFDTVLCDYFKTFEGLCLLDDLSFALEIARAENMEEKAKALAAKHSAHRFQRLAYATLGKVLGPVFPNPLAAEIIKRLGSPDLLALIKGLLKNEFGEDYGRRFGMMLQFDYALGFFQKIARRAIFWIEKELTGQSLRTGWLYNRKDETFSIHDYDDLFLTHFNAACIIDNYMMVLSGIFGEIHRLTADIEHWNIEFEDAGNRLTDSKADKLIYMDGAYQAGCVRNRLMRELMLYKS